MINVKVDLIETSQTLEYRAKNTYTKGPFYCLYLEDGTVQKFPVANIWRVTEEYSTERALSIVPSSVVHIDATAS